MKSVGRLFVFIYLILHNLNNKKIVLLLFKLHKIKKYILKEKYQIALNMLLEININDIKEDYIRDDINYFISKCYFFMNDYEKSIEYGYIGLNSSKDKNLIAVFKNIIATSYRCLGRYEKALEFSNLDDSELLSFIRSVNELIKFKQANEFYENKKYSKCIKIMNNLDMDVLLSKEEVSCILELQHKIQIIINNKYDDFLKFLDSESENA